MASYKVFPSGGVMPAYYPPEQQVDVAPSTPNRGGILGAIGSLFGAQKTTGGYQQVPDPADPTGKTMKTVFVPIKADHPFADALWNGGRAAGYGASQSTAYGQQQIAEQEARRNVELAQKLGVASANNITAIDPVTGVDYPAEQGRINTTEPLMNKLANVGLVGQTERQKAINNFESSDPGIAAINAGHNAALRAPVAENFAKTSGTVPQGGATILGGGGVDVGLSGVGPILKGSVPTASQQTLTTGTTFNPDGTLVPATTRQVSNAGGTGGSVALPTTPQEQNILQNVTPMDTSINIPDAQPQVDVAPAQPQIPQAVLSYLQQLRGQNPSYPAIPRINYPPIVGVHPTNSLQRAY